jgi:hypothetical protein
LENSAGGIRAFCQNQKVFFRVSLAALCLFGTGLAHAAPTTVQGTLTNVIIQPAAVNSPQPQAYLAIKPTVTNCFYGIMNIPNSDSNYGRSVVAAALSAQAGGKTVSITYDPAIGCAISQFVVLTP